MKKSGRPRKPAENARATESAKRIAQERLRDIELQGGPYDHKRQHGEGPNTGADPEGPEDAIPLPHL
jgi:hypothetical protein